MQRNGSLATPEPPRAVSDVEADKRALTESVAYALWEERRRRNVHDDPEADWYHAEELITELWNHRPPEMS
jgi:hypothetical protein